MNKRQVPFFTLFALLDRRRPFGFVAILFAVMTLSSLYSAVKFFIDSKTSPYLTYDSHLILQNGNEEDAIVTSIEPTDDILISNLLINYTYKDGKRVVSDKFEAMNFANELKFTEGDTIKINVYKNQSVIAGLNSVNGDEPIYLMPLIFLIPGVILGLFGFLPAIKIYNLYKTGVVTEATIFSMYLNEGYPFLNFGKSIVVNYYYFDSDSNKIVGTTPTYDLSIMQQKRPDDTIKIFVSETNETKSCMVPMRLAAKNNWRC